MTTTWLSRASARLSQLNPGPRRWANIRQHKWAIIHCHSQGASGTGSAAAPGRQR